MRRPPVDRTGRAGRHCRKADRGEDGSAAVELTLATPLLIALMLFVAVVVHRGVEARLRLDNAAHQAARAASLARAPAAAANAAQRIAAEALDQAGVVCQQLAVDTDIGHFIPGGAVTVTVSCTLDHDDALLLGIPGNRELSATFTSPIDSWRATTTAGGDSR